MGPPGAHVVTNSGARSEHLELRAAVAAAGAAAAAVPPAAALAAGPAVASP